MYIYIHTYIIVVFLALGECNHGFSGNDMSVYMGVSKSQA